DSGTREVAMSKRSKHAPPISAAPRFVTPRQAILAVRNMVGAAGFEPATPTSRTWGATRLRYAPTDTDLAGSGRAYSLPPWPPQASDRAMSTAMNAPVSTPVLTPGSGAIAAAAQALAAGDLVAFPTETVYGLGADATNGTAVARLYAAKGRPSFNPLIAHVPNLAAARGLAAFSVPAERLASVFWPGPLTLVLPKAQACPVADLATAGLDTIAVRVPSHAVARELLAAFGRPVVAPSANRSGHVSPTLATHVVADLGGRSGPRP